MKWDNERVRGSSVSGGAEKMVNKQGGAGNSIEQNTNFPYRIALSIFIFFLVSKSGISSQID